MNAHPLDSPVWASLRGPHVEYSQGDDRTRRYASDVSIFSGCALPGDWSALSALAGPGGVTVPFQPDLGEPPTGWKVLFDSVAHQMVLADDATSRTADVDELGEADVADMLALTKATKPGPFLPRTYLLGGYVGVREQGTLIAMAGTRFNTGDFVEISAVCTSADARGRGLAATLTLHVADRVRAAGATPFLHVLSTNLNALALYERLGFVTRRSYPVRAFRVPDE